MSSLPPPIASGRTADIYPWPDGRVLKLIKPGFAPFLADQEALGARIAYEATGLAPRPGEIIEVDGRRGVLLERISGPNLLEEFHRQPYRAAALARLLGELHARLHAATVPEELPQQRKRMLWKVEDRSPNLPADLKLRLQPLLLDLLDRLPDGDRLCHNDFHLQNVIRSPRGLVVVDWEPATRGSPVSDVADTCLKTRIVPRFVTGARGFLMRLALRSFEREYLRAYRAAGGGSLEGLEDWIAIHAALHLEADNRAEWPLWEQAARARLGRYLA